MNTIPWRLCQLHDVGFLQTVTTTWWTKTLFKEARYCMPVITAVTVFRIMIIILVAAAATVVVVVVVVLVVVVVVVAVVVLEAVLVVVVV